MLRLSAAMLLIGGPILALVFRSWGVGSLVFGLGITLQQPLGLNFQSAWKLIT